MMKNEASPLMYPHLSAEKGGNMTAGFPAREPVLLGPTNTNISCPFCNASIQTSVKASVNTRTHIAAALWCMICCMCCLPYCSDSAKNSDHFCPNCSRYLGTYHR